MRQTTYCSIKATLAVLFFLTSTPSVSGQQGFMDGYIIKKNRDSLRGQIGYKEWFVSPSKIVFESGGKSTALGPDDLLAFGVNGERYEAHTVHISPYLLNLAGLTSADEIGKPYDSTVFLQVLTSGKLTLWELRLASQANYYFVSGKEGHPDQLRLITRIYQQDNGMTTFDQQEAYKNQLDYLLQDCKAVTRRIARTSYNAESLRKLIFAYNYCGKDTLDMTAISSRNSSQLFVFLGYVNGSVKFPGSGSPENNQHWPTSSSAAAGIGLSLPLRGSQHFSFVLDLAFEHFHSESNTWSLGGPNSTFAGYIDYNQLKLDLLLRYSSRAKKLRPFLEAGLTNGFAVGLEAYENNPSYPYDLTGGALRNYMPGGIGGAGLRKDRWSLGGRVEKILNHSTPGERPSSLFTWYLLVSYRL
jgi:hypothetical protein